MLPPPPRMLGGCQDIIIIINTYHQQVLETQYKCLDLTANIHGVHLFWIPHVKFLSFCLWLISFSLMSSTSIPAVAYGRSSFSLDTI